MPRPAVTRANVAVIAVVLAAVAVAIFALTRIDRTGDKGDGLDDAFDYQIAGYKHVDPALVGYRQATDFPSGVKQARAIAVGSVTESESVRAVRIYVAGDRAIRVFAPDGTFQNEIPLDDSPRCLAIAAATQDAPGRIYVGMKDRVVVLDEAGKPLAAWENLGPKALLTSIAVGEAGVFVADAGNRVVLRYDTSGKLIGRIGGSRGFAIPSPFFDVAITHDGLVAAVHPAALRIECYSPDGTLERFWGEAGSNVEGFFGCCNPAHFAVLADGRYATAEKGLLRVKIHSADGQFECVVADHSQLETPGPAAGGDLWDHEYRAVDVAADAGGRIVVLDLSTGLVRVFVTKSQRSY